MKSRTFLCALAVLALWVAVPAPSGAVARKADNSRKSAPSSGAKVAAASQQPAAGGVVAGASYHNDTSPPLRDIRQLPVVTGTERREANRNPKTPARHDDGPDEIVQNQPVVAPNMPAAILNFDGIAFPGVACNCAPPDTNGEAGLTQYVQIANEGYQVFDKVTGASVLGPSGIATIWAGFGGVCQSNGQGDPVVIYDQLANRWVISQFAGASIPTDECVAVSTSSDATGSYYRYGFHLGTNFFDYPKLSVWPDAYYMSMYVFNPAGNAFLGPQPYALDRAAMLAGNPATFVTPGITGGPSEDVYLPADLDGSTPPPAGAPATFVEWPGTGAYKIFHFHADFAVPANSTFTLFAVRPSAAFTALCPFTSSCIPQAGTTSKLDGIGDRVMHRVAYRNFGSFESVVGNFSVSSGGVSGLRWFELRDVTSGPVTVFQESTYQPDTTWRWLGSAAMDKLGDLAVGFSASSSTISPQIRYAGRLAADPVNSLAQGESHLYDGTGSQVGTANRWGDYSSLSVDPVDDCTFWYTTEYYATTTTFAWKTRIGNFKFSQCASAPTLKANPASLLVDPAADGGLSDGNGVLEPGERAFVKPFWKNVSGALLALAGTASGLTGPAGAAYTLNDSTADYGSIAAGAAGNCGDATGNCYEVTVSNPLTRPATHWDAAFTETLNDGDTPKVWPLHVGQSFTDVPKTHSFYPFIERIFHNGVTTGCTPATYCPENSVFRLQMAVFLARVQAGGEGKIPATGTAQGSAYNCAPGGNSLFTDIPANDPFCRHVHYIFATGVTTGCVTTPPRQFCPNAEVTRGQMALFMGRAIAGSDAAVPVTYGPDSVTGRSYSCSAGTPNLHFTDVATGDVFCRHAHYLWARDVVSGLPDGTYGPNLPVSRGAMAKFLANGFNLQLYRP